MTTALVFDFDGTIVDSETPVYESWAATYRFVGVEPVARDLWLRDIGQADGHGLDVRGQLCEALGVEELPAEVEQFRRATRNEMLDAEPVRPGILAWIESAQLAEVPLAIASSSPSVWVRPHLERLGLASVFTVVSCADPGTPGKPDPTVYLNACHELAVDPALSVAVEDSPHGVSAAVGAGMRCIAAPGPMTRGLAFDHATVRVDSLAELAPNDWLTAPTQ